MQGQTTQRREAIPYWEVRPLPNTLPGHVFARCTCLNRPFYRAFYLSIFTTEAREPFPLFGLYLPMLAHSIPDPFSGTFSIPSFHHRGTAPLPLGMSVIFRAVLLLALLHVMAVAALTLPCNRH